MSATMEGALLLLTTAPTFRSFPKPPSGDLVKKLVFAGVHLAEQQCCRTGKPLHVWGEPTKWVQTPQYFCFYLKHFFVINGCLFQLDDHPQATKETLLWSPMVQVMVEKMKKTRSNGSFFCRSSMLWPHWTDVGGEELQPGEQIRIRGGVLQCNQIFFASLW